MPYYLAARFATREKTLSPYASIRTIIYLEQRNKLNSLCFSHGEYWYIVVIGDRPPVATHQKLLTHMNRGTRMRIGEATLTRLSAKVAGNLMQKERQP